MHLSILLHMKYFYQNGSWDLRFILSRAPTLSPIWNWSRQWSISICVVVTCCHSAHCTHGSSSTCNVFR
jgi:hypothetical protein